VIFGVSVCPNSGTKKGQKEKRKKRRVRITRFLYLVPFNSQKIVKE
jgi:hypothetical protein